jgi:raffinose/stachyose/melibiose transport system permease protein
MSRSKKMMIKHTSIENCELPKSSRISGIIFLTILSIIFLFPIAIVLLNSIKGRFYIASTPFALPMGEIFVGITNYVEGFRKTGLLQATGWSFFITIFSVLAIVLLTSMTAWYITRVKSRLTSNLYYMFVFSMIVPFQMVMFTMSKITNMLHLDNPLGIILIYVGFGSGLSVFTFAGFIKSIPIAMEEAAMMDGCSPIQTFFYVVFPILRPTAITVAILNTMWVWNDYLLPSLVLSNKYATIPMAVQSLKGSYGSIDMGAMMAMLVVAIVPIVIFYLTCQKYIIKGIASGAVKG